MSHSFGVPCSVRPFSLIAISFAAAILLSPSADARIVKVIIDTAPCTTPASVACSQNPTYGGTVFAESGATYEKISGRAYGELIPTDPQNSVIVDINNAPTDLSTGKVQYSVNFVLLKPTDLTKGNHRVFALIPNRGNPNGLTNMLGGSGAVAVAPNSNLSATAAGGAFLMRKGFSILIMGWDVSAGPNSNTTYNIDTPVATNGGEPIVGPSLEELVIDNDTTTLSGAFQYRAADATNTAANKNKARLSYRVLVEDPPVYLPSSAWEYVDDQHIRLVGGAPFSRGLYEFVYPAKDPLVAGIGLAAMRDVMSWFKYETADDQPTPTANPLAGDVQHIYTHCSSQPCRTMHDYVYLGFNEDEQHRQVMDGALNWIAAGNFLKLNYRFSNAGRTHRQHIGRWYPEFEFPFSNLVFTDTVTHRTDGKFKRCLASNTCPKWFEIFSENEYSAKAGSTTHFDRTLRDLPDPPHTRLYLMSSLPHGATADTNPGICQQNRNPLQPYSVLRAQLMNLDNWVTHGTEPPASRVPRFDNKTLNKSWPQVLSGFPKIPARPPVVNPSGNPPLLDQGLAVKYNGRTHTGDLFDYGSRYDSEGIVDNFPPKVKPQTYMVMVPTTDVDGNNIAGIRLPEVVVPTATYTGWALRANLPGYQTEATRGEADGCDASGQKIMFRATKAGRLAIGDPRLSLEERYASRDDYIAKVTAAANELKNEGLMLQEDVDNYISGAGAAYDMAILATP